MTTAATATRTSADVERTLQPMRAELAGLNKQMDALRHDETQLHRDYEATIDEQKWTTIRQKQNSNRTRQERLQREIVLKTGEVQDVEKEWLRLHQIEQDAARRLEAKKFSAQHGRELLDALAARKAEDERVNAAWNKLRHAPDYFFQEDKNLAIRLAFGLNSDVRPTYEDAVAMLENLERSLK
jgi:hypothetical protein